MVQAFTDRPGRSGVDAGGGIAAGGLLRSDARAQSVEGEDRRRGHRIRTVFRIAKVACDRAVGLWRVRNISDFGMMFLTRARPARGERLTVMLSDHVTIDGHIVWSDDQACGIAFEEPIDSAATLTSLVLEQREPGYRPPRLEACIPACIDGEDGVQPITINDVSQHGVGFHHVASVEPGHRVRILFDKGLERRGIVRWAREEHAGVELFDPLSCEDLEAILAA